MPEKREETKTLDERNKVLEMLKAQEFTLEIGYGASMKTIPMKIVLVDRK